MAKRTRQRIAATLLILLVAAGVTLLAQPFTAQIQIALQTLGLWPYGVYADGEVPEWSAATNMFVPGSGGGGGAPADATYLTQTPNAALSAEQPMNALASGIMRVATTTGVVTSLTTSAGIAANISDETGTDLLVFSTSPVLTTPNLGTPSTLVLTNATGTPASIVLTNGTGLPAASVVAGTLGVGAFTFTVNALAAVSTDGIVVQNTTAATGGATVQISPRERLIGAGWDSDDSVSRLVRFFTEVLPVSATSVSGIYRVGFMDAVSSAITYPFTLTSTGRGNFLNQLGVNGALGTEDRMTVLAGANDFGLGVIRAAGQNVIAGFSMKNSASGYVYVRTSDAGPVVASIDGVTATVAFDGNLIGGTQALSGAGAVNATVINTAYTSTGVAQALTLANGTAGQLKTIAHVVDGGSGVLTPTTALGYTTITFTNVGDAVTLLYTAQGWVVIGSRGAVVA